MPIQKITETETSSSASPDTHFLVTQPEANEAGKLVESLRRIKSDDIANMLKAKFGLGDTAKEIASLKEDITQLNVEKTFSFEKPATGNFAGQFKFKIEAGKKYIFINNNTFNGTINISTRATETDSVLETVAKDMHGNGTEIEFIATVDAEYIRIVSPVSGSVTVRAVGTIIDTILNNISDVRNKVIEHSFTKNVPQGRTIFDYEIEHGQKYIIINNTSGEIVLTSVNNNLNIEALCNPLSKYNTVEVVANKNAPQIAINSTKGGTVEIISETIEENINRTICSKALENILIEQGSIAFSNGIAQGSSETRLRSVNYFYHPTKIIVPNDILIFFIVRYDNEGNFISSRYVNSQTAVVGTDGYLEKVVFRRVDETKTIKVSDIKKTGALEKIYDGITNLNALTNNIQLVRFDSDSSYIDIDMSVIDYSSNESRKTIIEQVYGLFDNLVKNNPSYASKVDAGEAAGLSYPEYTNGVDTDGKYLATPAYKVFMYKFESSDIYMGNDNKFPKKKILIVCGTHGNETCSSFNAYLFAKRLCDGTDLNYVKLRSAFDVYIIPYLNGYGCYHNQRANANSVDINRNFPAEGWAVRGEDTIGQAGTCVYTGEFAGSEFETQLIMEISAIIKPDISLDHHNYQSGPSYYTVFPKGFEALSYNIVVELSNAMRKNMPSYFGTKYNLYTGDGSSPKYADTAPGHMTRWFYENGSLISATVEISQGIAYQNGIKQPSNISEYSSDSFKIAEQNLRTHVFRMAEFVLKNV